MTSGTIYDHEFANEKYGIDSDAVRYTWAAYYLFVIASSWIGDSIILVASIKYKAIKLHRVVVGIIQHIAVCDLMLATVNALIRFVSLIAEDWVFGRSLCYVATYVHYFTKSASIFLICAMATFKVLLLKFPLTFRTTSTGAAHRICALCWVAALILPGAHLIVDSTDEFFNYVIYQCYFGFTSPIWSYLRPLLGCLIILPPSVTIVAASIYLLVIANRVARAGKTSLNWQGTVTIILTAGIYILSYLPYFVSLIIESLVDKDTARGEAFITFYRIALTLLSFNTFSNFFVYCLAVHSFRSFVSSKIFCRTKQTEKGMKSKFENYLTLEIYLRFTQ